MQILTARVYLNRFNYPVSETSSDGPGFKIAECS